MKTNLQPRRLHTNLAQIPWRLPRTRARLQPVLRKHISSAPRSATESAPNQPVNFHLTWALLL